MDESAQRTRGRQGARSRARVAIPGRLEAVAQGVQLKSVLLAGVLPFFRARVVGWEKRASPSTRLDADGCTKRSESKRTLFTS